MSYLNVRETQIMTKRECNPAGTRRFKGVLFVSNLRIKQTRTRKTSLRRIIDVIIMHAY